MKKTPSKIKKDITFAVKVNGEDRTFVKRKNGRFYFAVDFGTKKQETIRGHFKKVERIRKHKKEYIKCPTLSELMDACGRAEFSLHRRYSAFENKVFYVVTRPGAEDMERRDSAEEAIKMLFLDINK